VYFAELYTLLPFFTCCLVITHFNDEVEFWQSILDESRKAPEREEAKAFLEILHPFSNEIK